MNVKLLGSSLITASLLMGSLFTEISMAGTHRKIYRPHHHKILRHHHRKVFRLHRHRSRSCRANHNRRNYIVTIANHKSTRQTYWIDGKEYKLWPGSQHTYKKIIGSTSRCRKGSFSLPIVEFDRYDNDRRYTSTEVKLNGRTSYYYFDEDSSTISLRKE